MKPLSLILLLISLSANSSDLSAPQLAIEKYFQSFNAKDIESLNNASGQPFAFIKAERLVNGTNMVMPLILGALRNQVGLTLASIKMTWFTRMI